MFVVTGFSTTEKSQILVPINQTIFLLLFIVMVFLFVYLVVKVQKGKREKIKKARKSWLANIRDAVQNLEMKKLNTKECFHLLNQSIDLPKEKLPQKIFIQVYLYEKLLPNIRVKGADLSYIDDSIRKISKKSKFLKEVEEETRKSARIAMDCTKYNYRRKE